MTNPNQAAANAEPGTPAASIAQVIAFIADRATMADLEPLSDACADRETALRAQRALTVEPGQTVKIVDIRPAWMKGLTGTVESIDRASGRKPRAQVRLDARSTNEARWSTTIPEGATSHLVRVPLACLLPQ